MAQGFGFRAYLLFVFVLIYFCVFENIMLCMYFNGIV